MEVGDGERAVRGLERRTAVGLRLVSSLGKVILYHFLERRTERATERRRGAVGGFFLSKERGEGVEEKRTEERSGEGATWDLLGGR